MSERLRKNPFFVLELPHTATRVEIERQGAKLLGMLELGLEGAARYTSPLGVEERTQDDVRRAMAELRDPEKRLVCEIWARARGPLDSIEEPREDEGALGTLAAFGFPR